MTQTHGFQINGEKYLVDVGQNEVHAASGPVKRFALPRLKLQEIPFDDPNSKYHFRSDGRKPFLVTAAAQRMFGDVVICGCLTVIQGLAFDHDGIDYLQVFEDGAKPEALWFIDDGDGGAVTALLPSDY